MVSTKWAMAGRKLCTAGWRYYLWAGDSETNHVGIVESVVDGTVYTVEGNSGDKVARRSYPIGYDQIYGYGVPVY